jgi:hypothetical protein
MKLINSVPILMGFSVWAVSISAMNLIYDGITNNPSPSPLWAILATIGNLGIMATVVIILTTSIEHEQMINNKNTMQIPGAIP